MADGERPDPIVERLQRAIDEGDREVSELARELGRYRSVDDAPSGLVLRLEVAYRQLRRRDEEQSRRELEEGARQLLAEQDARRRPDPWLCPIDGEPLRAVSSTYSADAVSTRYEHLDGRAHDSAGPQLWVGELVDGVEVQTPFDVVDVRHSAGGVSTVTARPRGQGRQ